jgi:hypothetical protein
MDTAASFDLILPAPAAPVAEPEVDIDLELATDAAAVAQPVLTPSSPVTGAFPLWQAPERIQPVERASWPATVPPLEVGRRALACHLTGSPDPSLANLANLATTRLVVARLSGLERAAVLDEIESGETSAALGRAASVRWRLAVASASLPGRGEARDLAALDALNAEAESAIAELATLVTATTVAATAAAIEEVRRVVVHAAVDFGAQVARLDAVAPISAPPRRSVGPTKAYAPVKWTPNRTGFDLRKATVWGGTALMMAILAGAVLTPRGKPLLSHSIAGAPAGVLGVENPDTGAILVQGTDPRLGGELDVWLGEMTREGWKVSERAPAGSRVYLLTK